jgi:hypothetical protein
MMPAPRMPAPQQTQPYISMWNSPDGQWLALLKYNGVFTHTIRDDHDEAQAAAVKFWREHTAQGKDSK